MFRSRFTARPQKKPTGPTTWVWGFSVLILCLAVAGCGIDRLQATLPAAVEGFTLSDLEDIQDDERLIDDERRELIREAVGASSDDSGDRLVDFLLTFNVP